MNFEHGRVDYYELCRLCTSSDGIKIPIFYEEGERRQIQHKIQMCLFLQIYENDSLPKVVCVECIEKLEYFYDFRKKCVASKEILESYFTPKQDSDDIFHEKKTNSKELPESQSKSISLSNFLLSKQNNIIKEEQRQSNPVTNESIIQKQKDSNKKKKPEQIFQEQKHVNKNTKDNSTVTQLLTEDIVSQPLIEQIAPRLVESNELSQCMIKINESLERNNPVTIKSTTVNSIEIVTTLPNRTGTDTISTLSKQRTHVCKTCLKPFKRKEHLIQHSKLHSGERPFVCDKCDKSFSRKDHLQRHSLSQHTNEKHFECDQCHKSFSRKDNLNKHRRTHLS